MTKIIIIGAGISGLSCALELVERGYNIEIYEASSTFGGQAKSIKTSNCYVPYAWRIWSNYYYNSRCPSKTLLIFQRFLATMSCLMHRPHFVKVTLHQSSHF